MHQLFSLLERRREELGIQYYSLSQTTLDQVRVCVYVCACVRACVRVCMCVALANSVSCSL